MKPRLLPSRRHFLKSAAIAGAAPLILRSGLRAAETAPSRQITLGFIGLGTQGRSTLLAGLLRRNDTRVLAVCDVDTTRRENAKKIVETRYRDQSAAGTYQGCATYNDFRELIARKDIDAVVIATPDHWHAVIGIAAANAGKDIYCEKPLTETIHEARALVNAVRKNNRIFQVGSMQRSSREFRIAAELVRNGVIGTVSKVDVNVGGPARPCNLPEEAVEPGLEWDMWLGPAPKRPYNSILSPRGVHSGFPEWRSYREYGGGGVTDWGAHHFDIVQWAFGMDESGPTEILPAPAPNANHGVRLRYATGAEVTHQSGNGITFYGDKGKLYVNRGQFKLWLGDEQKAEGPAQGEQVANDLLPKDAVRLYKTAGGDHHGDWVNSIRSRKPPICDVETGARTVTVCHLVNLAYYHFERMQWDPKTEQFAGSTGNPAWLTREYREPWKVS